jgi:hypothetical protein
MTTDTLTLIEALSAAGKDVAALVLRLLDESAGLAGPEPDATSERELAVRLLALGAALHRRTTPPVGRDWARRTLPRVRPGVPVPATLLVVHMGTGAFLLTACPQDRGATAYLRAEDAMLLSYAMADAFGASHES